MLVFSTVMGDYYDAPPEQIPELLADLENADGEHPDVAFIREHIGVGVLADRWMYIEDLEGDTLEPHCYQAPNDQTIIDIAHLLDDSKVEEIMANYPWEKGYPWSYGRS